MACLNAAFTSGFRVTLGSLLALNRFPARTRPGGLGPEGAGSKSEILPATLYRIYRLHNIGLGDRVECLECHRVWVWQVFNGWETSWKAWERC